MRRYVFVVSPWDSNFEKAMPCITLFISTDTFEEITTQHGDTSMHPMRSAADRAPACRWHLGTFPILYCFMCTIGLQIYLNDLVDVSDMFIEVSLSMWESLRILALLGQKLWDQNSFGLKTGRSKNRHVGKFLTQKQTCWSVFRHHQKLETQPKNKLWHTSPAYHSRPRERF